jgi:hypothetical protein
MTHHAGQALKELTGESIRPIQQTWDVALLALTRLAEQPQQPFSDLAVGRGFVFLAWRYYQWTDTERVSVPFLSHGKASAAQAGGERKLKRASTCGGHHEFSIRGR